MRVKLLLQIMSAAVMAPFIVLWCAVFGMLSVILGGGVGGYEYRK